MTGYGISSGGVESHQGSFNRDNALITEGVYFPSCKRVQRLALYTARTRELRQASLLNQGQELFTASVNNLLPDTIRRIHVERVATLIANSQQQRRQPSYSGR